MLLLLMRLVMALSSILIWVCFDRIIQQNLRRDDDDNSDDYQRKMDMFEAAEINLDDGFVETQDLFQEE